MIDLPITFPRMHPPSLVIRKGKWYVSVTVPKTLQGLYASKQIRRSTGTSDKALAKQNQHELVQGIYSEIRSKWLLSKSLKPSAIDMWHGDANQLARMLGVHSDKFDPKRYRRFLDQAAQDILNDALIKGEERTDEDVFAAIDYVQWESIDESEWLRLNAEQSFDVPPINISDGTPIILEDTVLGTLPRYLDENRWTRQATKQGAERHIKKFAHEFGNLSLREIQKVHAYRFAKSLQSQDKANKTIKSTVSSVSAFLRWCEQEGLINASQFTNLNLSKYGRPPEKYLPFSKDELVELFSLELPEQDRFLLSILITTGMRLDEAALLTWQRIRKEDGILCFDLTDYSEAITIKNAQSLRLVPIPDCLNMPNSKASGLLFGYPRDGDGKAEGAASKQLMKHIRKVTQDRRKVVHSLRGNLKDLLRNTGASKELNDFITGHGSVDEGGKYGTGFWLVRKAEALNKIEHDWL